MILVLISMGMLLLLWKTDTFVLVSEIYIRILGIFPL